MMISAKELLRSFGLILAGVAIASVNAEQNPTPVNAVQLTGLPGVKENAKGRLSVENGNLHFVCRKRSADVSASSIQDVVTGSDSQRAVGKTIGSMSMAAPCGGGRLVSLFRKKVDTLTVECRDADGALHGVIFTMPLGAAAGIKKELLAGGAHAPAQWQGGSVQASPNSSPEEQKQ